MEKVDRLLHQQILNTKAFAESAIFQDAFNNAADNTQAIDRLSSIQSALGTFDVLALVDPQGKVIASTLDGENGTIFSAENAPHLTQLISKLAHQNVYHSDIIISKRTGKPAMLFGAAIKSRDEGRETLGYFIANFAWPSIAEIIAKDSRSDNVNFYLFNKEGFVIASPATSNGMGILENSFTTNPAVQYGLMGKQGSYVGKSLANERRAIISYVPEMGYLEYKSNGWGLVAELPMSTALAELKKGMYCQIIGLLIMIIIIGAATFTYFVVRHHR